MFAGGFAVFWFYSSRRVPRQRQDFEGRAKGELLCRAVAFFPREVIENFPDAKRFCFADKAPSHPVLKSCIWAVGTSGRMNAENRGPIWGAFRGGQGYGDGDLE